MLRRLLSDSATYGVGAIAARTVSFLLVPLYTRLLAPNEYGVLDLLTVFGTLVTITVALEIPQALLRFFPDARDDQARTRIATAAMAFGACAYGVFIVVATVAAEPLGQVLIGTPGYGEIVRFAVAAVAASGLFLLLQTQLRAQFAARRYALSGLIYAATAGLVSVALVGGLGFGVRGVFAGQAVGAIVGIGVVLAGRSPYLGRRVDGPTLVALLRFSSPLVISSVAVFASTYLDRFAIRHYLGLEEVGLFGLGARVAAMATIATIAVQTAVVPLLFERRNDPSLTIDLARLFRLYVAASAIGLAFIGSMSVPIVELLSPREYIRAADVVPIVAASGLVATAMAFFPGLAIANQTRTIATLSVVGAIVNVGLLPLFVPRWGIVGAAVSTLLVGAVGLLLTARISQPKLPVDHRWTRIGAAPIVVMLALIGARYLNVGGPAAVALGLTMTGIVALAVLALGLVQRTELEAAANGLRRSRRVKPSEGL